MAMTTFRTELEQIERHIERAVEIARRRNWTLFGAGGYLSIRSGPGVQNEIGYVSGPFDGGDGTDNFDDDTK